MAKIVKYENGGSHIVSKDNSIKNVNCIYETQRLNDGLKMVVIKTYNPDSKKSGISQTIHFTK